VLFVGESPLGADGALAAVLRGGGEDWRVFVGELYAKVGI